MKKKLILRLRSLISKWFQLKTIRWVISIFFVLLRVSKSDKYYILSYNLNGFLVKFLPIWISKVGALVEGDPKAPFSTTTTPRCRWGSYFFPGIDPLYPWSFLIMRHRVPFFESLIWLNLGLNPGLPDHWRTVYSIWQICNLQSKSTRNGQFIPRKNVEEEKKNIFKT